jgi:hypothetical protein
VAPLIERHESKNTPGASIIMTDKLLTLPRRSPRYQRAFVRWFQANHSRFLVPVNLKKINAKTVVAQFTNHPDCLLISLNDWSLGVWVIWFGGVWDKLMDSDVHPVKTRGGYRCGACVPSNQVWPSLEAFWMDHLYEPFLAWVNDDFAQADSIKIFGSPDEGGCAKLNQHCTPFNTPQKAAAEIPLHRTLKQP